MKDDFETWWNRFTKGSVTMSENFGLKEVARAAWDAAQEHMRNQRKLHH